MLADVLQKSNSEDQLKVFTGSVAKQSATGNQDISLSGHSTLPDLRSLPVGTWALVLWCSGSEAATGVWSGDVLHSLGFAANGGGSVSQFSSGIWITDNVGTSETARRSAAKVLTAPNNTGSGVYYEAEMGATIFPTANSFRINWLTNAAFAAVVNYTLITGLSGAKVVTWNLPAATGAKYVSSVGFSPDLVFLVSSWIHSGGTVPASGAGAYFSFGAFNKHGQQWAQTVTSDDNEAIADSQRGQRTDSCLLTHTAGGSDDIRASFVSMHATDGFNLSFAVNAFGSNYPVGALCLDGISSKLGAFTSPGSATSQTVSSRQGFSPKGLIFAGITDAPTVTPGTDARLYLGMTDLTNSRVAALSDLDAADPSQSDAIWSSSVPILSSNGAGATYDSASLSSSARDSFVLSWSVSPLAREHLYAVLGGPNVNTFPNQLSYGFASTATAYSNQKKIAQLSTGRLIAIGNDATPDAVLYYSDDGVSWTNYAALINGWSNGSITTYVDSGNVEHIVAVWKQSGTGGSRTTGRVYVMVGTFNSARTTIAWGTAVQLNASTSYNYPDVVAHAQSTGGKFHIVVSYQDGVPLNTTDYYGATATAGDVITVAGAVNLNVSGYATAIHTFPSIAIDPVSLRLFVAWSAGTTGAGKGIRFKTASHSATVWTWATEVEVDTTRYNSEGTNRWMVCRWDSGRSLVVFGGNLLDGANSDVITYESSLFTAGSFTAREHLANTSADVRLYNGSMAIDPVTGDIYIFGLDNSGDDLAYHKWTRATTTLSSRIIIDSGLMPAYANAFVLANGDIGFVYVHGASSPYTVKFDRIKLS